jgi:CHAT domain-containing protein
MGKINDLKERINTYYYTDFDSVQNNGREIIRLSRKENLLESQLETIYTLCWCASYHKRMKEFQSYVLLGKQILKDFAAELKFIDATGIHRASMINAIGLYYYTLGNYDDAIEEYSQIIKFNSTPLTSDSSLLHSSCNYLGQSWYNLGSLDKSIQYFELANKYLSKKDEDFNYFNALFYMYEGEYQFSVDSIQEALASLRKALQLLKKEKDISHVRNSLKSNFIWIANFYNKIEKYDSAINYVNRAIELHVKNDPDFINTYRFLGDILYNQHKLGSALSYYSKSLNLSNQFYKEGHFTKSTALAGIGNVYRDKKQFEKAECFYKESLKNLSCEVTIDNGNRISMEFLSNIVLPKEGMKVMLEEAKLYYDWFQYNEHPGYLDSCIAILERAFILNDLCRRELINVETKELKALLQTQITDLGVEVSFKAYELSRNNSYLKKTFTFMEKSKGNILLDQVYEIRAKEFSGIPETVLKNESKLKGELSVNKDRILRMKSSDKGFNDIKNQYNEKLREYIALISEMEQKYPRYYKLKYGVSTVQVNEVQKHLPSKHHLMIQYYIGNNKIYIAGITKNQVVIKATERNDEFDHNIYTLLNQLGNSDILEEENSISLFNDFTSTARYLYIKILSPILEEIKSPVKELTIIPDGYLCYLPFEILLTREYNLQHIDYSILPYLIKDYQISYDYSSSLVIENPDLKQKARNSYIGYAPTYNDSSNGSTSNLPQFYLSSLMGNQYEIEECKKIWKGISLMGKKATERSFKEFAIKANILHLATHTFLDDENPQKSCFAFTNDEQSNEDGFLYTYELYNMNILAQLVILSGCETGIGNIKKGEGIISLARAFKFAGCPNIIMSLWKVNDQTTKEIMISFNENLKKGMKKDRALQQAKISYLNGSKNLHPYFWSSCVLIGNGDPIQYSGKIIHYCLILFCALLLIALFRRFIPVFQR